VHTIAIPSTIQFNPGFTATSLLHPATYLNKVLVASSQGDMQLWNIRTKLVFACFSLQPFILIIPNRTCIHTFSHSRILTSPAGPSSHSPCAITALTQSPAIDVVGIGFTSGEISVYDVRADERLIRVFMEGGGVRALSFRTGQCRFAV
jgi:U3 small nucleolar RNA-associated protein 21